MGLQFTTENIPDVADFSVLQRISAPVIHNLELASSAKLTSAVAHLMSDH